MCNVVGLAPVGLQALATRLALALLLWTRALLVLREMPVLASRLCVVEQMESEELKGAEELDGF